MKKWRAAHRRPLIVLAGHIINTIHFLFDFDFFICYTVLKPRNIINLSMLIHLLMLMAHKSSSTDIMDIVLSNKDDKKSDKKTSRIDRMKNKKNGNARGGGDDSVDSTGNIRNLIDYNYEEESDHDKKKMRTAAIKARKKIKKEIAGEVSLTSEDTPKKSKHVLTKPSKHVKKACASDRDFQDFAKKMKHKKNGKKPVVEASDSEEDSEEDENTDDVEEIDEDETDETYDEDEDDEEEEDEDDEDDETDETDEEDDESSDEKDGMRSSNARTNLIISLGGGEDEVDDWTIPKHHNLKKEPKIVKKFVKLVTAPMEDNTIDVMIDEFKKLTDQKQSELITGLENRPTSTDSGVNLMLRILSLKVPQDIQSHILAKYNSLQTLDPSAGEYFKLRSWLDKIVNVPFGKYVDFPIRLDDGQEKCTEFMTGTKKLLDDAIFSQDKPKLQVMQFMSTKIVKPENNGISLLLIGPPGIGKTSLIKNGIAKALKWPFQFISLGGDSDASSYMGHQLVYESSHCGKIINSIISAKSMNCVMLFDELDKISTSPKGEEIQNLLIHLTDPQANTSFEDKYFSGIPVDLSKIMFIFSANDITKIDKVLLDRLVVIHMGGYDFKDKVEIAKKYLIPASLAEVNLTEKLEISDEIVSHIIENYSNGEKGVRQLKRNIDQISQKVNMLRMFNMPSLPFYIENFRLPFVIKKEHIDLFITKSDIVSDAPPFGMYT